MIKTKGFSWLFYSILFGIACGLAQLTKETAILFLFIPLIYYFLRSYSSDKKKTVVFNFIIALLAFFIVSGSVYFQKANFLAFHTYLLKMETHTAYPFYYLKYFRQITGPIVFILGLPLLLNYFVNFRKRENLILIWFLAPIALFSISPNCSMRFLLPITPALALILVREIFASEFSKVVKNTLITCFICLALIQYALYNTGFLNKTTTKDAHTLLEIGILSVKRTPYQNAVSELFEIFKKEAVGINSCKSTMCLLEIREIYYPLNRRLLLAQLPFNLICPTETDETDARSASFGKTPEQILSADYLLVTTQYKHISHGPLVTKIRDVLQEGFDRYKDSYRRIAQVKAQDGSIVYVYKKI